MSWEMMRQETEELHDAREAVLRVLRKLGQLSARAIRHIHRRDFDGASALLTEAGELASAARKTISDHPGMNPAYLHDVEKEFVEALLVRAICLNQPLPRREETGASTMAYLHGACEAASEVRRSALDELRRGDLAAAEAILRQMDEIYERLIEFDFPDSLTFNLRRAVDALRAVIERTHSDLALTATQQRLVGAMKGSLEG